MSFLPTVSPGALLIVAQLVGCVSTASNGDSIEPSFIEVTLQSEALGTQESPLPFAGDDDGDGENDPQDWAISVRTLDRTQALYSFEGDLTLAVRPGGVEGNPIIHVSGGEWSGTVPIRNAFGPTRIWASDEGDQDIDSARVPSWATGVTDPIWYALPTIAEMQATSNPETNALAGEYAELRAVDRQIVVTALTTNGFWATDILDDPGSGNSLFIYTFSKPADDVVLGAQVVSLAGIDQEYLATTQLYWPNLDIGTETLPVPDAILLDPGVGCDENAMEGLEAARVDLLNWQVPADFGPGSDDYADFEAYGQWPITLGSCTVYVESGVTVPDFYPPDHAGETITRVSGMVNQIFSQAVIIVLDASDLDAPTL